MYLIGAVLQIFFDVENFTPQIQSDIIAGHKAAAEARGEVYGYIPFFIDASPLLQEGDNVIRSLQMVRFIMVYGKPIPETKILGLW